MQSQQDLFKIEGRILAGVFRRWWKPIAGLTGLAAIVAVVFTGPSFMPPVFKSRAIVYPANITPFATENATEQLIQILESEDIRNRAIESFDLMAHYGVDPNGRYPKTELYGIYAENVSISKTQYESAEVTVFDHDPNVASALCDSLLAFVNDKINDLNHSKYAEVVRLHRDRLDRQKVEMDSMETAIRKLRTDYGILEFEEQVKPFARTYYPAVESGKAGSGQSRLDRMEQTLADKGGDYISLKEHLWRVRGYYNQIREEYEQALAGYYKTVSYVNIVTRPFPAEKKTYPLRMLIVAGTVLATAFFSFLLALIHDRIRGRI